LIVNRLVDGATVCLAEPKASPTQGRVANPRPVARIKTGRVA